MFKKTALFWNEGFPYYQHHHHRPNHHHHIFSIITKPFDISPSLYCSIIHFILTFTTLYAHWNILFGQKSFFYFTKVMMTIWWSMLGNLRPQIGKSITEIHLGPPSCQEHAKSRHIRHFTLCSVQHAIQYALCNMQYHVLDHHPAKLQKVDIFCRLRAPLRQFRKRCLRRRFFVGLPKIDNLSSFLNT